MRLIMRFNPRVLAGGRDYDRIFDEIDHAFQSTRPRGRTRRVVYCDTVQEYVSIHASSREDATEIYAQGNATDDVSIHASSREDATGYQKDIGGGKTVSIHASSREDATRAGGNCFGIRQRFNPRVLAGGRDSMMLRGVFTNGSFNPRVLAGGRDLLLPRSGCG